MLILRLNLTIKVLLLLHNRKIHENILIHERGKVFALRNMKFVERALDGCFDVCEND